MFNRKIAKRLRLLAQKMPVVTLTGPRQAGKTTLARSVFPKFTYANLEEPDTREHAHNDPRSFLASLGRTAIIDEVQRVPALLSYLQAIVDDPAHSSSRYIITGSANLLLLEAVSQSLAGRTAIVNCMPLSMEELREIGVPFGKWEKVAHTGFYPRIYDKKLDPQEWLSSYVNTYIERDVRSVINVKDLQVFQTFLRLCAGRVGQLLNFSSLGNDAGIDHKTAGQWLSLLETTYVIFRLPPFYRNFNKRLIKAPKLYFWDTGIACFLLGIKTPGELETYHGYGGIFENFCLSELRKNALNNNSGTKFFFWRDSNGHEIDCLAQTGQAIDCIEMKAGRTISEDFFKGLDFFSKTADGVKRKTVIYGGDDDQHREKGKIISWQAIDFYVKR